MGIAGIEFYGSLELLFRALPLPIKAKLHHRQRQVRFRNRVINTQSFESGHLRFLHHLGRRSEAILPRAHQKGTVRQAGVSQRRLRIDIERALVVLHGLPEIFVTNPVVPKMPALQVEVVGQRIYRSRWFDLGGGVCRLQGRRIERRPARRGSSFHYRST